MVISSETPSLLPEPPIRSSVVSSTTDVSGAIFSFPVVKTRENKRVLRLSIANMKRGSIVGGDGWKNPSDVAVDACDQIGRLTGCGCADAGDGMKEEPLLEETRDKFLIPVRVAVEPMNIWGPSAQPSKDADVSEKEAKPEPTVEAAEPSPHAARPWNLRTRRRHGERSPPGKDLYLVRSSPEKRTVRLRSEAMGRNGWPKFSIALTREEIDEDIYAVTGHRARGRPRKRPWVVQRNLDGLLPGSWLSEVTAASYRVRE